jgi:hypothetical protein
MAYLSGYRRKGKYRFMTGRPSFAAIIPQQTLYVALQHKDAAFCCGFSELNPPRRGR